MKTFLLMTLQICFLSACSLKQERTISSDTTQSSKTEIVHETHLEDVVNPENKLRFGGFLSFKNGDTLVAINPAGVPMMESAGNKSKKIKTLQYGVPVNIRQNLSEGKDDIVVNEVVLDTIHGKWIKVGHDGNTGFVFSAFLGRLVPPAQPQPDYQLLPVNNTFSVTYDGHPEYPCTNNFDFRPDFRYYGLYSTEEGLLIRPVDLFFYIVRRGDRIEETYFEQYVIKANTFFSPSSIIGCKSDIKEQYVSPVTPDSVQFINSEASLAPADSLSVEVVREGRPVFYIRKSGRIVLSKKYGGFQLSAGISVFADLNLDGTNDYIVYALDPAQWSFNGLLIGDKNNTIKLAAQYEDYDCY